MKVTDFVGETDICVCFSLSGRVDSANADSVETEMFALRKEYPAKKLEIDLKDLEYISSAGLRVLLKLQKQESEKILVKNVSSDVAEIFEMTGFSQILEVRKAFREISIEDCELIGRGANGCVYRLDEDKIVKVYQPTALLDDVMRERNLAQRAFVKGIPTAIAYDVVQVGDCLGVVFELLAAKSLSETIVNDIGNYAFYADRYVEIYKQFHTTNVEKGEFPEAKEIYHTYIDGCADWYSKDELEKLHKLVDSIPDQNTLIHGDYHARNIMVEKGELLMIDMGDVSVGHPVFDFLATAATQANLVDLNPEYAPIHTGMPVEMIKRLWNDLLKLYFNDKTADEIAAIDKQVRIFAKLKVALAPVVGRGAGDAIINASVQDAKDNLIPIVDNLVGSINW